MGYEWFPSFSAIPGIVWTPLVSVDRAKLEGVDAVPRKRWESLDYVEWASPDDGIIGGSRSPAAHRAEKLQRGMSMSAKAIAKTISESLDLPGTRSDYHFALLGAWRALEEVRSDDPNVFGSQETLCLADIQLMEQGVALVFSESHWNIQDDPQLAGAAFELLVTLYSREGFVAAAVEIEDRWEAVGRRDTGEAPTMRGRQASLLEEDGY